MPWVLVGAVAVARVLAGRVLVLVAPVRELVAPVPELVAEVAELVEAVTAVDILIAVHTLVRSHFTRARGALDRYSRARRRTGIQLSRRAGRRHGGPSRSPAERQGCGGG